MALPVVVSVGSKISNFKPNTMKTNKFVAVTLGVLFSAGAYAQTVDEIVDKHIAALGGKDKLDGVKSLVIQQSISVQGMEIPVKTTVVTGKSMRSESQVMGNSMVTVVDGTTGWSIRPAMMGGTGEPQDMTGDELKQAMNQVNPFGALINYKDRGTKVELVGKEKVGKDDMYHLKITSKEGQVVDEYLDANTYLVSKLKTSTQGQNVEIDYSDYKEVEGIKFANTMEMENPMAGRMAFITEKITINGPVDESIFKKPAK